MISIFSFVLIFISAILHPIWNILLKRSEDKVNFHLSMHFVFTVFFSFLLFIFPLKEVSFTGWLFVILSSFTHFFYQIFLCRSYELGDISLTYPIIRSSPLFVVILAFIFLKEIPSRIAFVGIVLVIIGSQIINTEEFSIKKFFRPLTKNNKNIVLMATVTALFSALYSAVDKKGVLEINPLLFFYLFFTFSGLLFGIYLLFFKEKRQNFLRIFLKDKSKIILASVLEFSSYLLILYAFRLSKVAYVVALRQISVVFGVIFGTFFLKEKYLKIRLTGALIIFIGIFFITAFG